MKYKNNPFNIRYTGQQWKGLAGHRSGFCEFESLDYGIRAWLIVVRTFRSKYNLCTIRKIIERFAPPSENNTDIYIKYVSELSDILADKYLNFNYQYYLIGRCMAMFESKTIIVPEDFSSVADKFNISIVP